MLIQTLLESLERNRGLLGVVVPQGVRVHSVVVRKLLAKIDAKRHAFAMVMTEGVEARVRKINQRRFPKVWRSY